MMTKELEIVEMRVGGGVDLGLGIKDYLLPNVVELKLKSLHLLGVRYLTNSQKFDKFKLKVQVFKLSIV